MTHKNLTPLGNENGFALMTALIFLAVLSLIAMTTSKTSLNELRVTTNIRAHKTAFNTAESGISYVIATPGLYGTENLDPEEPKTDSKNVGDNSSFSVSVLYKGPNASQNILRGSGFSAGRFRAHNYRVDSDGSGPVNSVSNLRVEGYRIGF